MTFLTILLQQPGVEPNQFNGYLILGYLIMWLIGMVYVASLFVRQRNLRQDVELMENLLQEDEHSPEP